MFSLINAGNFIIIIILYYKLYFSPDFTGNSNNLRNFLSIKF